MTIQLQKKGQRKTNAAWFCLYVKLKNKIQTERKLTHTNKEQIDGCHKGEGGGMREKGVEVSSL